MTKDVIPEIAARYNVPETVVRELYEKLQVTGGRQCQVNCPELGGPVQWMPGMTMVSRWDDHQLKARVDGLCSELAAIIQGSDTAAPAALKRDPGTAPAAGCVNLAAGDSWWPAAFGAPTTSGEQNGIRYAYFPEHHRLLVQQGARIEAYDTGDRRITGAAQQQGHSTSLTFASEEGPVDVKHLKSIPMG